jgi:hypothetical protein
MACKLADVATIIPSESAKPNELTLDVIFSDRESYEEVVAQKTINRRFISELYDIAPSEILDLVMLDATSTIRILMRRSGADGTDAADIRAEAPLLAATLDLGP